MGVFLLGGGWAPEPLRAGYGAFLAAAPDPEPAVACVVLDEGDGDAQFARFSAVLSSAAPCRPVPVLVPVGERLEVGALSGADALLVCGGLTPGYAAALAPGADDLRAWLAEGGRPYAGFSAGAAVAARRAVVGGWRAAGVPLCPDDAAEDLDEVTVVDGLGLVPFAVEVHCAQWGTLPRLVAVVEQDGGTGVALDEDTVLEVRAGVASVSGAGHVRLVTAAPDGVRLRTLAAGEQFRIEA